MNGDISSGPKTLVSTNGSHTETFHSRFSVGRLKAQLGQKVNRDKMRSRDSGYCQDSTSLQMENSSVFLSKHGGDREVDYECTV